MFNRDNKNNSLIQNSILPQLNNTATQFNDVVNLTTHALSNLLNVLKTIKYNETNISKASLVQLKRTGDLLVSNKGSDYKDVVDKIITNTDQNLDEIKANVLKMSKKMGNYEITNFMNSTLDQLLLIEQKLKSLQISMLKPIDTLKKVLPKLHEDVSRKPIKENQLITENTIVTYLKMEYIVKNSSNPDLVNGWKVICDGRIYKAMSEIEWHNIGCDEFKEKYNNFEIKSDIYYYFEEGDKLADTTNQFSPNHSLNQKKITLTNELKSNLERVSLTIGKTLNEYLLIYGQKLQKIVHLKKYTYPIVPTNDKKSVFIARPFQHNVLIDPMIGTGHKEVGYLAMGDLDITFNGSGEFIIATPNENLMVASGKSKKKRKFYDRNQDLNEIEKEIKTKKSHLTHNTQIYAEISSCIERITSLKADISKINSEHLIESIISIDGYLNIEYLNQRLTSGDHMKTHILNETELSRAINHLNFILLSDEKSAMSKTILNLFKEILNRAYMFILKVREEKNNSNNQLVLDNFYIKSDLIILIYNKIESMIQEVNCTNQIIWKINEWPLNEHDDLKSRFDLYFEKSQTDPKKILFKNVDLEKHISMNYSNKIKSIKEINLNISNERTKVQNILKKFFPIDYDFSPILAKQKTIASYPILQQYFNTPASIKNNLEKIKSIGDNFRMFIDKYNFVDIFKEGNMSDYNFPIIQLNMKKYFQVDKDYIIKFDSDDLLLFLYSIVNIANDIIFFTSSVTNVEKSEYNVSYVLNGETITNGDIGILLKYFKNFHNPDNANLIMEENKIDYENDLKKYYNDEIKDKLILNSDKIQLELPGDDTSVVDLVQSSCLDVMFKKECNYVVNPIGPSSCGKSTFIFGRSVRDGLLTDILNYNTSDHFYYAEWYCCSFPMVESINCSIKKPRIDMYFVNNGKIDYISSDKFHFDNKFKISKRADYTQFIQEVKLIKQNKTRTERDSGINSESSRGFSLLIIELQSNGRKYYKTILDSPGLETLINVDNPKLKNNAKSIIMWSNPFIALYRATQNCNGFDADSFSENFKVKINNKMTYSKPNHMLFLPAVEASNVSKVYNSADNSNVIPPVYNENTILTLMNTIKQIISPNITKTHEIDSNFWNLKIGPEISKTSVKDDYFLEFGIKSETITLGEFFNVEVIKTIKKKSSLTFEDVLNPLFGLPLSIANLKEKVRLIVVQLGENFFSMFSDSYSQFKGSKSDISDMPSINKGSQCLQVTNLAMITFFITCYSFYYRIILNKDDALEPIKKFRNEIFNLAFPGDTYDDFVDLLFESIIINEINLMYLGNVKNGDTLKVKTNSYLRAPCTMASQMYMAAYVYRDFDYINASYMKACFDDDYFTHCSVSAKKINENILSAHKYFGEDELKILKLLTQNTFVQTTNYSDITDTFINKYNDYFINNYIFNECFSDKKHSSIESDTFVNNLFLKKSSILSIIVLSATLIEKEKLMSKDNALVSYTQLFMHNKNSTFKNFKIKD